MTTSTEVKERADRVVNIYGLHAGGVGGPDELDPRSDVFDFGPSVKVEFEDVYKEYDTDSRNTALGVALNTGLFEMFFKPLFYWTQALVYYILAIPLGAILVIGWAVIFAINRIIIVWLAHPLLKLIFTWVRIGGSLYRCFVRILLDPFNESLSLAWLRIRAQLSMTASARVDQSTSGALANIYKL